MSAATQIDVDPPSNPDTPSEMPGTPTSTTTSLSALSTTAIKDGHRGSAIPSAGHHHHVSTNTLEAERADRISRLAGLERVATVRPNAPGSGSPYSAHQGQVHGYFDAQGNPMYVAKMSTVGSASATGSSGGNTTTWVSGSGSGRGYADADTDDVADRTMDQMSMETKYRDMVDERDQHSMMEQSEDGDGMSDEGNASLVGFGEGAGSTMSGPTYAKDRASLGGISITGMSADAAERIVRERLDEGEKKGQPTMGIPEEVGMGKFYSEENKK